ncbi:hypothetical protein [Mesoaciditoga sp.]
MKKVYVLFLVIALSSLALAGGIMSFVPQSANFVVNFTNNSQNYDALKKVNVFSFLLNDLGIENLIQASVSQTAVSIGVKSSQVWQFTKNDFAIFGNANVKELNLKEAKSNQPSFEVVLKGKSKILLNLLSALVGGNVGKKNVDNYTMNTFETNGITLYVMEHEGYTLISNDPELISQSIKTYEGKYPSFTFSQKIPSNIWFEFYTKNSVPAKNLEMVPTDGYGYAMVENNALVLKGTSKFKYNDAKLRDKLISFNPNARSLEEMPATGDLWAAVDIADPVGFYDLIKKYAQDFNLEDHAISTDEGRKITQHLNGKAFLDASLSSEDTNFAATIYLAKDLSEYIPEFSKDASATFTWKGHTVTRDDTVEGTKTTHTFTIFYPNKIVITDMEPQKAETFIDSSNSAKEMGNYSFFANSTWNKAFLIAYIDVGKIVKSLLQYPLVSGAFLQMKFDKDANLDWQLMIK